VLKVFTAVLLGIALALGGASAAFGALGLQVFVHLPSGVVVTLDVESSDSIENVRQKLQDKTLILPEQQRLVFGVTELLDGRTVADYNLQQGDIVELEYAQPLALVTPTFPPFTLAADYTSTISAGPAFSPLTFALTAGSLPAGVTFDPATATFAGRPTTAGPYAFTITATRDDGTSLAIPFAGTIAPAVAPPAAPEAALVETGVDPLVPLGFASMLLLVGVIALVRGRTRRA